MRAGPGRCRAAIAGHIMTSGNHGRSELFGALAGAYNAGMRGAQITVRCDCGDVGYVPHGERWRCPRCGRTWNTAQIPAEEYWGIMRDMRRLRINVIFVALAIAVPFVALIPLLGARIMILLPLVMGFWLILYMPRWRRRVREQARSLQKWTLRPE
jgi:hypothetical protein